MGSEEGENTNGEAKLASSATVPAASGAAELRSSTMSPRTMQARVIGICFLLMTLSFLVGTIFQSSSGPSSGPSFRDRWLLATALAFKGTIPKELQSKPWFQQEQQEAGGGLRSSAARPFLQDKKAFDLNAAQAKLTGSLIDKPLPKAFGFLLHGDMPYIEQFLILWHRLYEPESFYAIHLHLNSEPEVHEALRAALEFNGPLPNVKILPATCITWGGPNMVGSTLQLIRALLPMGEWSHFILLSGTHYPVRPSWYIDGFLRANDGISFLHGTFQNVSSWQYPSPVCDNEFGEELDKRYFCKYADDCEQGINRTPLTTEVTNLGAHDTAPEVLRKLNISVYTGSQWVLLSREAALYMINDPLPKRLFDEFYSTAGVADESYFQTAIYNNPALVTRTSPTYATIVYWGPDGNEECIELPCLITSNNAFRIKKDLRKQGWEGALFARKFEYEDKELYDYVDKELLDLQPRQVSRSKYRFPGKWRFELQDVQDKLRDMPYKEVINPRD